MILVQTFTTALMLSLAMTANAALDWERAASTFNLMVPTGGGDHFASFFSGEGAFKREKTQQYSLNFALILNLAACRSTEPL